ncbi:MAG: DNA polymerase III subunit delta, partial [Sediminibacterium sp.]|nr:DNA polymerase III subunit delta [Sediminibacterium sp.]
LFNAFSKLYLMQSIPSKDPKLLASKIGITQVFMNDYFVGLQNYSKNMSIKKNLLVLFEYNLKMLGINSTNTEEADLLTEMINKILID